MLLVNLILFIALIIGFRYVSYSLRKRQYSAYIISTIIFTTILLSSLGFDSGRSIILMALYAIGIVAFSITESRIVMSRSNILYLIILTILLALILISSYFNNTFSFDYGIWKLSQFIILIYIPCFLMTIFGMKDELEFDVITDLVISTSVLMSISVILQRLLGPQIESSWFQRETLGSLNIIWVARYLSLSVILFQFKKKNIKILNSIVINLIYFYALFLTGSKIVLYVTIPLILYVLIKKSRRKISIKSLLVFCISAVIILFVVNLVFSNYELETLTRRFSLSSNTTKERLLLITNSFSSYINNDFLQIVFGSGFGSVGESLGHIGIRVYPHNIAVEILYELGFVSIIYFLIVWLIYKWKSRSRTLSTSVIVLMFFLFSLTSGDFVSNNLLFIYLTVGFIETSNKVSEQEMYA